MWLSLLNKSYGFVIQVILVIAAVLIFSYFDPIGILTPRKLTLKDTPITVESIQDIGELITAEYYGEVVKSYKGTLARQTKEELDNKLANYQDIHEAFASAIIDFGEQNLKKRRRNKVYEQFTALNENLVANYNFASYLYYLKQVIEKGKYNKRHLDRAMKPGAARDFIKDFWEIFYKGKGDMGGFNSRQLKNILNNELNTANYIKAFAEANDKKNKKTLGNNRLVLLGRGWVKAGYDFKTFTNDNFKINISSGRIDIIGLKAQILSKAINPWFIPEKNVPGFEILIAKKGAKRDSDIMLEVKRECLAQLLSNAEKAHILQKAKTNAIENLEMFFSLLLDKEIKVFIHDNVTDYALDFIHSDGNITLFDVFTADSALINIAKKQDLESLDDAKKFVDTIKTMEFEKAGKKWKINRFQSSILKIAEDGVLTEKEIVWFSTFRNKVFGYDDEKIDFKISDDLEIFIDRVKIDPKDLEPITYKLTEKEIKMLELIQSQVAFMDLAWGEEIVTNTTMKDIRQVIGNDVLINELTTENNAEKLSLVLDKQINSLKLLKDMSTVDHEVLVRLHQQLIQSRLDDYNNALILLDSLKLDIRLTIKDGVDSNKKPIYSRIDFPYTSLWKLIRKDFEAAKMKDIDSSYTKGEFELLIKAYKNSIQLEAQDLRVELIALKNRIGKVGVEKVIEENEEADNEKRSGLKAAESSSKKKKKEREDKKIGNWTKEKVKPITNIVKKGWNGFFGLFKGKD